ncbi:MAG: L-seryl-tRNA(Sec) selenium transferase [Actinomycetota bacterium]|nr:L-seryl-tRNA(Sec) selenium transferase [Actinomycetota bacterium]
MASTTRGNDPLRRIPSVDALLRSPPGRRGAERFGRPLVKWAVQGVLDAARADAARGIDPPTDDVLMARAVGLAARTAFGLSPVINATGVILHTGLGRAPLPRVAVRAAARAAQGYADLEVDRETGKRGKRTTRAEALLIAITGAEAAFVVNNNAAALLLALTALARRREILVSRGELIEIGGEFRLPDIMAASGAKLVEVGTTNRTRLADYRNALSPKTGLVLKVHPSNYRVIGFTQSPAAKDLAALAAGAQVPFLYDLGSGLLHPLAGVPLDEPPATSALAEGADLVCFSGDKLLGGPQAGILLGRADLVERLRRHPIARALRVDKMQVAALEAVLRAYANDRWAELPVWRMFRTPATTIRQRAKAVAAALDGTEVRRSEAVAGGGSLPGYGVPSWAVALPVDRPEVLAARLRQGRPPVFCRVEEGVLLFDLRTVEPADDEELARAVRYALGRP